MKNRILKVSLGSFIRGIATIRGNSVIANGELQIENCELTASRQNPLWSGCAGRARVEIVIPGFTSSSPVTCRQILPDRLIVTWQRADLK
jgi:hypothetical protein